LPAVSRRRWTQVPPARSTFWGLKNLSMNHRERECLPLSPWPNTAC
jgi:hypothetical protein